MGIDPVDAMHYHALPMLPFHAYLVRKKMRQLWVFLGVFAFFAIARSQETIIVSGAGPAGLATAISLRRQGADVLLVEQRSQDNWGTRPQVLGLSQESKAYLISLGLEENLFSRVSQFSFFRENTQHTRGKATPPSSPIQIPYGNDLRWLAGLVLTHNPEEFVVIGELEKKLLARYLTLGGKVSFDTNISALNDGVADVENMRSGIIKETPYKWIINSEGAHSDLLLLIKQHRVVDETWSTLFFSGEKNEVTNIPEVRYSLRPRGEKDFVSAFMVTDGKNFSAGLDMRGKDFAAIDPEANSFKYLRDLGLNADTVKRVRVTRIQITQSHLERFYFSNHRMLVIGDAAHTVNPLIAYGVNVALQEASYLGKLLATTRTPPPKAFSDFEKFMTSNVATTQRMNRLYMSQSRLLTQGPAIITNPLLRGLSRILSCKNRLNQ